MFIEKKMRAYAKLRDFSEEEKTLPNHLMANISEGENRQKRENEQKTQDPFIKRSGGPIRWFCRVLFAEKDYSG